MLSYKTIVLYWVWFWLAAKPLPRCLLTPTSSMEKRESEGGKNTSWVEWDKCSLIRGGGGGAEIMQKQSSTSRSMPCQSQARSALEKQLSSSTAEHDVICCGMFSCSIQVSCSSCCPLPASCPPSADSLAEWEAEGALMLGKHCSMTAKTLVSTLFWLPI